MLSEVGEFGDKITSTDQAARFLKSVTLCVEEGIVRQVVTTIKNGEPTYRFWKAGQQNRAICAKGTVAKIKKLYKTGLLNPYLSFLTPDQGDGTPRPEVPEPGGWFSTGFEDLNDAIALVRSPRLWLSYTHFRSYLVDAGVDQAGITTVGASLVGDQNAGNDRSCHHAKGY